MSNDVKFIDSQTCVIDGEEAVYLREHISLLRQVENKLSEIGAKKFFSDPSRETQTAREALAEYFFLSALKKDTGKDWWILQPKDDPLDFILMTIENDPITITLDQFELVEIQERCKTFDEMMDIINTKLNKGYPKSYHLLIFVNHVESKNWINLLNQKLEKNPPLRSIWTVYLLFKNKSEVYSAVVNRIRPSLIHIEASFDDSRIYQQEAMPSFTKMVETKEGKFLRFKQDFSIEFRKALLKMKLGSRK